MLLNIICLFLGIIAVAVGAGLNPVRKEMFENENHSESEEFVKKKSATVILIVGICIIIFSFSFKIIPTGYTGIRNRFGQISKTTLHNGFNLKIPFVDKIEKVNNKQQDIKFEDTKISSETSERNEVFFSKITITYRINPKKSAWIAANISDYEDNLVSEDLVSSAIKSSAKTLSPVDVTNRNKIEPIAQENIQKSLDEKYGKDIVSINKVVINNATFDKDYNDKIAKKQQAQMDYEKQQIENKKSIEKANADAQVNKTNAQGEADAIKIKADAQAEANKILNKSLSKNVLQQNALDKWNGEMPKVYGGSNSILDISNLIK